MNYSFFSFQIALHSAAVDPTRGLLRNRLAQPALRQSLDDKRAFYDGVCRALIAAKAQYWRGCWDLDREPSAEQKFRSWCTELESLTVGSSGMKRLAATAHPADPATRLTVVTGVFLVAKGGPDDQTIGARCDLPARVWHRRSTYARLVDIPRHLAYTTVHADGIYVYPNDPDHVLTPEVLNGPGYAYLNPIT